MTKAGERILKGAEQVRAYLDGETTKNYVVHTPEEIDVRAIRKKLGMKRAEFARRYGFSADTIKDWELKRRYPERAARILLKVIEREPEAVDRALAV